MNGAFDLTAVRRIAATALGVISAADLGNAPRGVANDVCAGNEISITESHLPAGREPKELLRRIFQKVILFYVELPAKRQLPGALRLISRVIECGQFFLLILRIILDHQFQWPGHRKGSWRVGIESCADTVLKNTEFDILLVAGDADTRAKVHQRFRGITPSPHTRKRWHARIIPSTDNVPLNQSCKESLADDRVFQGQSGKFCLIRAVRRSDMFQHPVI